jgi:hypothetical protein
MKLLTDRKDAERIKGFLGATLILKKKPKEQLLVWDLLFFVDLFASSSFTFFNGTPI